MTKLYNWNTWKKNNKPTVYGSKDSSLGYISTIEPTLKAAGFIKWDERDIEKEAPYGVASELIPEDFFGEAVYYVYRHPRGYFKRVELFIKKLPKG